MTKEKGDLTSLQEEAPDSTDITHCVQAVKEVDRLRTLAEPLRIDKPKDAQE